jgi:Cu(I)/Ag(I) efflux system membrane protein CusA/SilA
MISFAIRNTFITLAVALGLAVAGLWAWRNVPVDAIPDLSDNQVIVWASVAGQNPQDMDQQVTAAGPRTAGLPGVQTVRGMSLYGASYVYIIFEESRDLYDCRTRVLERLSQMQGVLPAGVTPRLGPDATAMGQVFAFTLHGPRDVEASASCSIRSWCPPCKAYPGVAEVAPAGGVVREYQIDVDPARIEEQGLTLDMLMMAVQQAGRDVGAMSVEQSGVETMIRGAGFIRSVEDVENIVLRGNAAWRAGLRLGDIAEVHLGGQFRQGALADENTANTWAPSSACAWAKIPRPSSRPSSAGSPSWPRPWAEQLTALPFYDRSQLIHETTETLTRTLREAIFTTILVVVVFLLHARASLRGGHQPAAGHAVRLPGDAPVRGERQYHEPGRHRHRHRRDGGFRHHHDGEHHPAPGGPAGKMPPRKTAMPVSPFHREIIEAVVAAAREVTRPLITSAATTIIGFLPIFALTDQAGRLFEPLALTKSLAIGGAVLFGTLLVPLLCRLLLPPWHIRKPILIGLAGAAAGSAFGWFIRDGWALPMDHGRWALQVPGWLFAPAFAVLCGSAVWKIGREKLVNYEENPVSYAIHVAYEWAYNHIQRHRVAFTLVIAIMAGAGYLLGAGWTTLSWPLRKVVDLAGGDFRETRLHDALVRTFPGVRSSFLPPLDEGSLLFHALPARARRTGRNPARDDEAEPADFRRTRGGLGHGQAGPRRNSARSGPAGHD